VVRHPDPSGTFDYARTGALLDLDGVWALPDSFDVVIRAVQTGEAAQLREIRLRALLDSPDAFGSTHAREVQFSGEVWGLRAARSGEGKEDVTFVADDDGSWIGMVTGHLDSEDASRAGLYGLWVEPAARGSGVGLALTDAVADWARSRQARSLYLLVVASNAGAIGLYHRAGFSETGRTLPLPRDPSVVEIEMVRPLGVPSGAGDSDRAEAADHVNLERTTKP
jgi:ribosomal protein S18 acetylase RimI-like enzyme